MAGDEVEVLLVDQQRINKFSRLNNRLKEVIAEIEMLKVCNSRRNREVLLESCTNMQGRY